jgi:hypothetical protein
MRHNILLLALLVAALLAAFTLDDPGYYGPGNNCPPPNQPTPCH